MPAASRKARYTHWRSSFNDAYETTPPKVLRSKSWDEYAAPGASSPRLHLHRLRQRRRRSVPRMAREADNGALGHRGSGGSTGSDADKAFAFRKAFRELETRIKLFVQLPIASLSR